MIQDISFSRSSCAPPLTQGIKYAGSKLKLLPHILRLTRKVPARTVWDAFSGTTRVSQAFAQEGYQVISSDVSIWSEIFGQCYLLNTKKAGAYQKLIDHLNAVPGVDGWFTVTYGGTAIGGCSMQKDGLKKPWQIHNTRKLDGIREEIDRLSLPPVERAVALTSLILALDEVDNTLGHFVSYLQQWSERSF
ncbi:MAG: DNA adenine methylase, partial [Verrucomicrobia bacterium]|nr:DNA adenine methylase [Verrucomicrobiota bacterium]